MANYYRRYKLTTSAPILFLCYGLGFGILEQFPQHRSFSWISVAFIGIPFGLVMTVATRRRFRKFDATTGLNSPEQQWGMHDTARTGKLPTDPDMLKAMPAYLNKRIKTNEQSRKYTPAFMVLISIINIVLAIWDKSVPAGAISALLIALAIMTYFIASNQTKKLNRLQKQLK